MWNIKDKIVLITGSTNGIGKATAIGLAGSGAHVVIHGRDEAKAREVLKEIADRTGSHKLEIIIGDLSSLSDVKKIAEEFKSRHATLDVLINNAGGVYPDTAASKDGYEMTFAVNHLSHFLLTRMLMDRLIKSAPSRIIHVSSEEHRAIKDIDVGKLVKSGSHGATSYSTSKACNVLFAYELAERLKGSRVTSNALHPGLVKTGFGRTTKNPLLKIAIPVFMLMALSPEQGALTSMYLAASDEVDDVSGKYFKNRKPIPSAAFTYATDNQKRLWEMSENLVKSFL